MKARGVSVDEPGARPFIETRAPEISEVARTSGIVFSKKDIAEATAGLSSRQHSLPNQNNSNKPTSLRILAISGAVLRALVGRFFPIFVVISFSFQKGGQGWPSNRFIGYSSSLS